MNRDASTMPDPRPQDGPGRAAGKRVNLQHDGIVKTEVQLLHQSPDAQPAFAVGKRVYLKGAPFGAAGRVLRIEQRKVVVLWADLGPSYIGRHSPESLILAVADNGCKM